MSNKTLFDLPEKTKVERKAFERTQRWICKRCKGSVTDKTGAYCHRFDLCLEFEEDGKVVLSNDGWPIECNGEEWKH